MTSIKFSSPFHLNLDYIYKVASNHQFCYSFVFSLSIMDDPFDYIHEISIVMIHVLTQFFVGEGLKPPQISSQFFNEPWVKYWLETNGLTRSFAIKINMLWYDKIKR